MRREVQRTAHACYTRGWPTSQRRVGTSLSRDTLSRPSALFRIQQLLSLMLYLSEQSILNDGEICFKGVKSLRNKRTESNNKSTTKLTMQ